MLPANADDANTPVASATPGSYIHLFFQFKKDAVATAYFMGSTQTNFAVIFQTAGNAAVLGTDRERGGLTGTGLGEVALGFAGVIAVTAIKSAVKLETCAVGGDGKDEESEQVASLAQGML